ncbi:30S ribosomal protein S20 [Candidatus Kaiserbacteria bacterium]|nr:30S ribosomal protein S20 [Candidatus Kaiserbacteria bacterium]
MPITKGAIKTHRSSQKKRVYNVRRKVAMHDVVKELRTLITSGDLATAEQKLPNAYKAIDKAAKRGIIKDNTASRKKSRLMAAIKRAKTTA